MSIESDIFGAYSRQMQELQRVRDAFGADLNVFTTHGQIRKAMEEYGIGKYSLYARIKEQFAQQKYLVDSFSSVDFTKVFGTSASVLAGLNLNQLNGLSGALESPISSQIRDYRNAIEANFSLDNFAIRMLQQQSAVAKLAEVFSAAQVVQNAWNTSVVKHEFRADTDAQDVLVGLAELKNEGAVAGPDQTALETLLRWLNSDVSPALRRLAVFLVLYVLMPYVISIVANLHTPYYEVWYQRFKGDNKREEVKKIREEATQKFPVLVLSDFKLVTTKSLNLRLNPKAKSPVLVTLSFGMVVRALQTRGAWTYVGYSRSEDDEEIFGWVFSRYVRPLIPKGRPRSIDSQVEHEAVKRLATLADAKAISLNDL